MGSFYIFLSKKKTNLFSKELLRVVMLTFKEQQNSKGRCAKKLKEKLIRRDILKNYFSFNGPFLVRDMQSRGSIFH